MFDKFDEGFARTEQILRCWVLVSFVFLLVLSGFGGWVIVSLMSHFGVI